MISRHELAVFQAATAQPAHWFTNHELAEAAGVSERTARLHTRRLADLGVLSEIKVYPGYRYKAAVCTTHGQDHYAKLLVAAEVLGE